MSENYKSISGKEYSKFVESPSRVGESAIEIYSLQLENISKILIQIANGNGNLFLFDTNLENLTDENGKLLTYFT